MFIPRSLKRKQHDHPTTEQSISKKQAQHPKQLPKDATPTFPSVSGSNTISDINNYGNINLTFESNVDSDSQIGAPTLDDSVKQYSSQQRLVETNSDEPICIICGKYGEYINDETENDVCR